MVTIEHVRRCLAGHQPEIISSGDRSRAAVALVLRPQGPDPGVLLIRRAELEGDRWSAHLAQHVGQEMGSRCEAPDRVDDDPRELVGVHRVLAVFVDGVGVIDGAQDLLVPPVDPPAVTQENLVDRLLVEQLLERGIAACGS